jgi:hypothetical protein
MTELMEVKTAELSGAALDWAVAQVEKVKVTVNGAFHEKVFIGDKKGLIKDLYKPSTDWSQGGPLIAKYWRKATSELFDWHGYDWTKDVTSNELIWFCRAIVASVLGDTVSVPKELV